MTSSEIHSTAVTESMEACVALFLALLLGHLLGDFVFQPGRLVVAKRHGWKGMLLHTGIVVLMTAIALMSDIERLLPALVLAGLAHLGIEYLTIRARRMMEANGLALFLLDQALHIVSLAIIAALMGNGVHPALGPWPVDTATLAFVCGLLAVMFLGSILAFEVRVLALGAADPGSTGPILRLDADRMLGFAERGAAFVIGLLSPMPALGILAFAPRATYALTLRARDRARQMSDAAVGLIICAVVWLLVVFASSSRL